MSSSRSQGHGPTTVNARSRRRACVVPARAAVSRLARDAAAFDRPLDLERWTSSLLGRVWERRRLVLCHRDVDLMLRLGAPLVESFAAVGGRGAKTVLSAVASLEPGPLGLLAAGLAAEIDVTLPPWSSAVGTARVVRALALGCSGDTEALLLETNQTGDGAHMVAVFIDGELGGIAKRLGLTRVLDDCDPLLEADHSRERGRAAFKPVAVLPACRRVRAALTLTDESEFAPIGEEFIHHRALALARVVKTLAVPARP